MTEQVYRALGLSRYSLSYLLKLACAVDNQAQEARQIGHQLAHKCGAKDACEGAYAHLQGLRDRLVRECAERLAQESSLHPMAVALGTVSVVEEANRTSPPPAATNDLCTGGGGLPKPPPMPWADTSAALASAVAVALRELDRVGEESRDEDYGLLAHRIAEITGPLRKALAQEGS